MDRVLAGWIAALVVGVGVATAPAAPVPPDVRKPLLYYPTLVGTELVYDRGGAEVLQTVTSVEEKDGVKTVTIEESSRGGPKMPFEKMAVSEKGLTRLEISGQKLTPPLVMLRVPHPKGDKWEFTTSGAWANGEVKGTKTVPGPEKIEVIAGTFETIRVDSDYTLNGQNLKATFWYAPHIGTIKVVPSVGSTLELKSYKPPQD